MKRLLIAALLVACSKKEPVVEKPTTAQPAASSSSAAEKPKAAPATFKGAYTAKQAEVRTPSDAPAFIHPESKDGVGAGELELTLPGGDGAVTGKATGALGAQIFSGWLEGTRLTGTLHPEGDAASAMWGLVEANVEGSTIKGTLRTSNRDGRLVREAPFTLEKK